MFYEVRIFNARGKLKKILSGQELTRRYWEKINGQESGSNPVQGKVKRLSSEMRRQLDAQMPKLLLF
jgi:hypothetical protein